MEPESSTCHECGAARPRRAAGCPRCGAIFGSLVTASAEVRPAAVEARPATAAEAPEPEPQSRMGGCGSCALLAVIVTLLTAGAGAAVYLLARRELAPLVDQFEGARAGAELTALGATLTDHARLHGGEYPATLLELEQTRAADGRGVPLALRDPWGVAYGYELSAPRGPARVFSLGADGEPGGEGADADIEVIVPGR